MKNSIVKTVLIGFLMTVFGSAAFAEFTIAPRIGASSAVVAAKNSNNGTIKALNFGADVLLINDSDLALKWSLGAKFPWSEKSEKGELISAGDFAGVDFSFGVGKALVRNEKLTLALTGIVGTVVCVTSENEKKYPIDIFGSKSVVKETSSGYVTGGKIGADLTAIVHLSQHVGVFANAGLYYFVAGSGGKKETKYSDGSKENENTDVVMFNGCVFNPSLGVSITF